MRVSDGYSSREMQEGGERWVRGHRGEHPHVLSESRTQLNYHAKDANAVVNHDDYQSQVRVCDMERKKGTNKIIKILEEDYS